MMYDLTHKILGLPVLASEHGKDVDGLIIYVHWLMMALFIGWFAFFVYALIRFRKSRHPKADYVGLKGNVSNYAEVAVALVEAILLLGFAIPLWAKVVDSLPNEKESVVMRVIAQQFGWNVRYPGLDGAFGKQDINLVNSDNIWGEVKDDPQGKDDIKMINEIHVPVNKQIIVHLSSKDVIHSFKVIALRITQDAIPGMRIPTFFKATKEGRYQINCAQLCGNGHSAMTTGFLTVESQASYDQWVAQQSKGGGAKATTFE
jgi:cytochrome c oxidase subunit 2